MMITIADHPVEMIYLRKKIGHWLHLEVIVDLKAIITMLEAVVMLLWKH